MAEHDRTRPGDAVRRDGAAAPARRPLHRRPPCSRPRRDARRDLVADLVLAWIDALGPVIAARRPPGRWSRGRRAERDARVALDDALAAVPRPRGTRLARRRPCSPPASRSRSPPGAWLLAWLAAGPSGAVDPVHAVWETLRLTPPTWITARITTEPVDLDGTSSSPGRVRRAGQPPAPRPAAGARARATPTGSATSTRRGGRTPHSDRAPGCPSAPDRTPVPAATSAWRSSSHLATWGTRARVELERARGHRPEPGHRTATVSFHRCGTEEGRSDRPPCAAGHDSERTRVERRRPAALLGRSSTSVASSTTPAQRRRPSPDRVERRDRDRRAHQLHPGGPGGVDAGSAGAPGSGSGTRPGSDPLVAPAARRRSRGGAEHAVALAARARSGIVALTDRDLLPDEAAQDRDELVRAGVRSLVATTFMARGEHVRQPLAGQLTRRTVARSSSIDDFRLLNAAITSRLTLEQSRRALAEAIEAGAEAQLAYQQLFGAVGHELRTPLSAILGYTEGLLDDAEHGDRRRPSRPACCATARSSCAACEQLLTIVDSLLGAGSRAVSATTQRQDVALADAVADVVHWHRTPALHRGRRDARDVDPALTAWAHPSGVRQVLPTSSATPSPTTAPRAAPCTSPPRRCWARAAQPMVRIIVRDDGPGLTPEQLAARLRAVRPLRRAEHAGQRARPVASRAPSPSATAARSAASRRRAPVRRSGWSFRPPLHRPAQRLSRFRPPRGAHVSSSRLGR